MKRIGSFLAAATLAGAFSLAAAAATVPPATSDSAPAAMQAAACPAPGPAVDTTKLTWKGGKDEYDAYNAANSATTAADKIAKAQAFIQKYPDSEWKSEAVNLILLAQLGTPAGIASAEGMIKTPALSADKLGNAYLAIVFSLPNTIQSSQPNFQQELDELSQAATCGSQLESSAMEDKAKPVKMYFFERAAAVVAMDKKQFPEAVADFKKLIANVPAQYQKDHVPLYYYWMGVCQVQENPPDYPNGIYNLAHAVNMLGSSPAAGSIKAYLSTAYSTYHGSGEGIDQVISQATAPEPPAGWHIPDLNEVAQKNADSKYQADLKAQTDAMHNADNFQGWKYRLQQPDQAAEQWTKFKGEYGSGICLDGTVTTSDTSPDPTTKIPRVSSVSLAVEGKATDTHWTLSEPGLPISKQPSNGSHLSLKGIPESFSPNPPAAGKEFVLTLSNASIVGSCQ